MGDIATKNGERETDNGLSRGESHQKKGPRQVAKGLKKNRLKRVQRIGTKNQKAKIKNNRKLWGHHPATQAPQQSRATGPAKCNQAVDESKNTDKKRLRLKRGKSPSSQRDGTGSEGQIRTMADKRVNQTGFAPATTTRARQASPQRVAQ